MSLIKQTYLKFLKEKIIKDYLIEGIIPTASEVESRLDEVEKGNPGFSEPFTVESQYFVKEFENSSAKKINETFSTIYQDLSVLYMALIDQASLVTDAFDSINNELNLISKKTAELEEKASSLLFFAADSAGNLDFVSDYFQVKDKINLAKTTCLVDTSSARVTLPVNNFSRINLGLVSADVQFSVITRAEYIADSLAPGSDLLNAFSDLDKIWLQRVSMRRGTGSVTVELILRVPQGATEVNRIMFTPASSDEGNITTVTVQYSQDGLNWSNTVGENSARLIGQPSISFQSVKASYWKFIFNKAGYDEYRKDTYIYEFGMKSIQLYGVQYSDKQLQSYGTLVTRPLISESGVEFNKANLSVCEVIPKGANIEYFIAGLSDQELQEYNSNQLLFENLAFIPLDPQERKNKVNLSYVDFAKTNPETGFNLAIQKNNLIEFKNKTIYDAALEYQLPASIIKSQIKILRNIGDNTEAQQVLGLDKGWVFDHPYYRTNFYIEAEAGFEFNFGNTEAIIDGQKVTGRIVVASGYHTFVTHRDNWRKVNFTEIQNDSVADPLYPFNHKYLIEGIKNFLYNNDLSLTYEGKSYLDIIDPDGSYRGVSLYWSETLSNISFFEFSANTDIENYSVYCLAKDFDGVERVLVKQSSEQGLMIHENFAIITKSVNGDLKKALILKADFYSDDSKLTPILDEYVIKLGY